ncbi:hypothetical protein HOO65_040658 [Ceratocystis lukuohia]|uniref:PNPLA domain-containing protein n=1 Tax=Ceratocystis lukuohia TaxID=2019550 RepID=A0ABR4MJ75_9PEZI
MSSATQPNRNARPSKILSPDDGGVGGLPSLFILENTMEKVWETKGLPEILRPCKGFGLIGGTGTGGIVAIMLGRLGMSIEMVHETLGEISVKYLDEESGKRPETAIRENCRLEKCIQEREEGKSTVNTCQHENKTFLQQPYTNTVVLAMTKANIDAHPILFKTYRVTASFSEFKIREAGRATSAIVSVFKPIKLGRENEEFMNSSFGHSNPFRVPITEATKLLSGHQKMLTLSIGTGLGSAIKMGDGLAKEYSSQKGRYYRIDTANSQGSIVASDWVNPSKVAAHTTNYRSEKHDDIKRFANILINGFSLVSGQPEEPEEPEDTQRLQEPRESEATWLYTRLLYSVSRKPQIPRPSGHPLQIGR